MTNNGRQPSHSDENRREWKAKSTEWNVETIARHSKSEEERWQQVDRDDQHNANNLDEAGEERR